MQGWRAYDGAWNLAGKEEVKTWHGIGDTGECSRQWLLGLDRGLNCGRKGLGFKHREVEDECWGKWRDSTWYGVKTLDSGTIMVGIQFSWTNS